jgi:hypothetical protein
VCLLGGRLPAASAPGLFWCRWPRSLLALLCPQLSPGRIFLTRRCRTWRRCVRSSAWARRNARAFWRWLAVGDSSAVVADPRAVSLGCDAVTKACIASV